MNQAIYSAVSGSLSALDRLDAITNNLANASTPGFKAQMLVQRADHVRAATPNAQRVATPINRRSLETNFAQGSIESTGNPFNLALSGPGFFVVDGTGGEKLTRRGTFSLDAKGFLVTSEGQRVQGDGGDLALGDAANDGPIEIGPDGTIQVGNNRIGKVRVVAVPNPQQLDREGASAFSTRGVALTDAPDGSYNIRQGALEGANVSPVSNLVALIETMRGFEAYMTATSRLDQINSRAITDVARV